MCMLISAFLGNRLACVLQLQLEAEREKVRHAGLEVTEAQSLARERKAQLLQLQLNAQVLLHGKAACS